jgi:hypothetical protein
MIWSDKFVWLHVPKCAGVKTEQLFSRYFSDRQDIHQDIVDVTDTSTAWHDSLAVREERDKSFSTGNRVVICPIRRLPGWLESRYNFEVMRNPHFDHNPNRLLSGKFLNVTGIEVSADYVVQRFLPPDVLYSSQLVFLRVEFFEEDFRLVFAPFIDISRIPPEEFSRRANVSQNHIPPDIHYQLWHDNDELYQQCPWWHEVETLAYRNCP